MAHIGLSLAGDPPDLHFNEDGALAIVERAQAIGQHVGQRLKTHRGEWFLDSSSGVQWHKYIFGRQPDPAMIEALIKAQAGKSDGVTAISEFSASFDVSTRKMAANMTVNTVYDQSVEVQI